MTEIQQSQNEPQTYDFIDRGLYPHKRSGSLLSLSIVAISSLAFWILTPPDAYETITLLLTASTLPIVLFILYIRLTGFRRMEEDLILNNSHSTPPPKLSSRILVFVGGIAFLLGPLFTAIVLPPLIWLASLGAIMLGLNIGELVFTMTVRGWMRSKRLSLYSYEIWATDESGRGFLYERGVKATHLLTHGRQPKPQEDENRTK